MDGLFFEPHRRLLFIGDSITDSGRRDVAIPYGNGYVNIVRNFLIAQYPELNPTIINRGIGGNTIREMAARWETDAVLVRPDYLCVCVGINDVYRQFFGTPQSAVFPDEFRQTYRRILWRSRQAGTPRLIVMPPYMIEPDRAVPMRKQMDVYGTLARQVAQEFNAVFVPLQDAWDTALRSTTPHFWSADQFHVNEPGAALIAQAFLRAVGYQV